MGSSGIEARARVRTRPAHHAGSRRWPAHPRTRGGPLRLTVQGAALAEAAPAALEDLDRATRRMRETASGRRGTIAAPPSVATRWLLPRLPGLQVACPGAEVSITVVAVCMGALDPHADLTVRMGPCPRTAAVIRTLGDDEAFPVMGTAAWEAAGRPDAVEALRGLPLLHDRDTTTAWAAWRDAVGPSGLDVARGPRLTSADLVLRAAEQGQGVALTRGWLAADTLAEGRLVRPFGAARIALPGERWIADGPRARAAGPSARVRDRLPAQGADAG